MSKLTRRLGRIPEAPAGRAGAHAIEVVERRRARMAALQGALESMVRRAGLEPVARQRSACELPFVSCEGRHQRAEVRGLDDRIGNIPVGLVTAANQRLLAQLALTPALEKASLERALYLDTETTGLGGGTGNLAFLVGLAYPEAGAFRLEQLFLREPADEAAMLERVGEHLERASVIVTFNGKSFDMPLLRARFVMNGMKLPPERPHLNLLHLVRRVHKGRGWRKSLGVLEREVLGFRRGHDVGGEEVALRYRHYLRTGDGSGLGEVVTHNARDVWSLVALTGFYGEPLERLEVDDLPWLARAVRRSGDLERAEQLANLAIARGGGVEALRARAEIAKAARQPARALATFEAVAALLDAGARRDPFVGLELAKLYEHHAHDPARALAMVERGVAEDEAGQKRRRLRLLRKIASSARRATVGDGASGDDGADRATVSRRGASRAGKADLDAPLASSGGLE